MVKLAAHQNPWVAKSFDEVGEEDICVSIVSSLSQRDLDECIIILRGDHGFWREERVFQIRGAWRFDIDSHRGESEVGGLEPGVELENLRSELREQVQDVDVGNTCIKKRGRRGCGYVLISYRTRMPLLLFYHPPDDLLHVFWKAHPMLAPSIMERERLIAKWKQDGLCVGCGERVGWWRRSFRGEAYCRNCQPKMKRYDK